MVQRVHDSRPWYKKGKVLCIALQFGDFHWYHPICSISNNRFEEDLIRWLQIKFDAFLVDFMEFVNLIADSKFTFVKRVDLVSAGRVLMSFVDLRHLSNQRNYTINFNPY